MKVCSPDKMQTENHIHTLDAFLISIPGQYPRTDSSRDIPHTHISQALSTQPDTRKSQHHGRAVGLDEAKQKQFEQETFKSDPQLTIFNPHIPRVNMRLFHLRV